jgi:hypothetical protein
MKLKSLLLCLIFSGGLIAQQSDDTQQTKLNPNYQQLKKSGKALTIAGGAGMVIGAGLLYIGSVNTIANGVVNIINPQPVEENNGKTETIIGSVLFFGGAAALIVGLSKSSKARRMLEAGTISFQPYVPPLRLSPKAIIPQTGFTINLPLSK